MADTKTEKQIVTDITGRPEENSKEQLETARYNSYFSGMSKLYEKQEQEKASQLLYGSSDKYGIYQLKENPELDKFRFAGTEALMRRGITKDNYDAIRPENYTLIYVGELSDIRGLTKNDKLEEIFARFNANHPEDYKGHSLSVSDIVVLHKNERNSAYFVDSFGFTSIPAFMRVLESEIMSGQGKETVQDKTPETETNSPPAFYGHTLSYAIEHGEADAYKASYRINKECKFAIEETILHNFDGMRLNHDIALPLAEKYGSERMAYVLANTVQCLSWDGRFSRTNKAWAQECRIEDDVMNGASRNQYLVVVCHPAVLDGFINMFRRDVLERDKEKAAMQESEQDKQPEILSEAETQAEQSEPEPPQTVETSELEDGDELIDLGGETDQVLADLKKSIADSRDVSGQDGQALEQPASEENPETELAFQIADRFVSIQETDGGYDYSIIGTDYKVIDGGVYDNPDVSIREALEDIVSDLQENNALADIGGSDGWMPMDYDGLMEKVEAAERIEPQTQENSVVENFRAKTDEMFHAVKGMKPADFEEIVKCHVQAEIDENFWETKIVDAVVVGSRCRGLERNGSDIDVVVELATNEREDSLFNVFNEDGLRIAGIKVDINPITAQKTGTLETYLPQAEEYLTELRKTREKEQDKSARPSLKARIAKIKARTAAQEPEKNVKSQEKAR